jgi:hypothetical protein
VSADQRSLRQAARPATTQGSHHPRQAGVKLSAALRRAKPGLGGVPLGRVSDPAESETGSSFLFCRNLASMSASRNIEIEGTDPCPLR